MVQKLALFGFVLHNQNLSSTVLLKGFEENGLRTCVFKENMVA